MFPYFFLRAEYGRIPSITTRFFSMSTLGFGVQVDVPCVFVCARVSCIPEASKLDHPRPEVDLGATSTWLLVAAAGGCEVRLL